MTEVKKTIVIASVLKPVNDTRMTEKIAASLAASDKFSVHVIGASALVASLPNLHAHPLGNFKRLSLKRVLAPLRVLSLLLRIRPDFVIVCTHELLVSGLITKLLTRCKVVYDVQENYYRNIRYTNTFPLFLRNFVASYVRTKERITAVAIDHFILAETSYAEELTFLKQRFTILENKVKKPSTFASRRMKNQFLFSGTLAPSTGVYTAIDIAAALYSTDSSVRLSIIGYAAQDSDRRRLRHMAAALPFLSLVGIEKFVPHEQILAAISNCDAGIICYPDNPSTSGSVPTKLYEYLGYKLPIILAPHPVWTRICDECNAALIIDPQNFDPKIILQRLEAQSFYISNPDNIYWENYESRLVSLISSL